MSLNMKEKQKRLISTSSHFGKPFPQRYTHSDIQGSTPHSCPWWKLCVHTAWCYSSSSCFQTSQRVHAVGQRGELWIPTALPQRSAVRKQCHFSISALLSFTWPFNNSSNTQVKQYLLEISDNKRNMDQKQALSPVRHIQLLVNCYWTSRWILRHTQFPILHIELQEPTKFLQHLSLQTQKKKPNTHSSHLAIGLFKTKL